MKTSELKKGDVLWASGGLYPPSEVYVLNAGPQKVKLGYYPEATNGFLQDRSDIAQRYYLTEAEAFEQHLKVSASEVERLEKALDTARERLARSLNHKALGVPPCQCGHAIGYHNRDACNISHCKCEQFAPGGVPA